jgi:hypothetical protein
MHIAHGQPDCGYKDVQNISEAVPGVWATYFRIPEYNRLYPVSISMCP